MLLHRATIHGTVGARLRVRKSGVLEKVGFVECSPIPAGS